MPEHVSTAYLLGVIDWLPDFTWKKVIIGVLVMVVTFVVATGIVTFVVVKLPRDYFHPSHKRGWWSNKGPVLRWTGIILKNLSGVILILLGIAMSLPGIPGPGLITVLFGIMLLDFPGRRWLEHKIVTRPKVLKTLNHLRKKYDKPPFDV